LAWDATHIGFGVRQISFGLQQRAFEQRGVDLCHYLSFFYPRIEIRIEPRNRARNLRTYLHRRHSVDGAGRFYHLADVSAIHFCSEILWLLATFEPERSEDSNAHDHQTCYQPMTFQKVHDISF
jgi:hypothetical protein